MVPVLEFIVGEGLGVHLLQGLVEELILRPVVVPVGEISIELIPKYQEAVVVQAIRSAHVEVEGCNKLADSVPQLEPRQVQV